MSFDSKESDGETHAVKAGAEVPDTDVLFSEFGITYIADKKTLKYMHGTTIDYVETLRESGFKFNNPRPTATCGCGKSFA
jgi:iron-sulfur cluster assembly protein